MSKLTMIRKLLAPFLFLNIASQYQKASSLAKIQTAKLYIQSVSKVRLLFLCIVFVILAFSVLTIGIMMIHSAFFTYSLWSFKTKFVMALTLGVTEMLGGVFILWYLLQEKTWIKFADIDRLIDSVNKENKNEIKTDTQESK